MKHLTVALVVFFATVNIFAQTQNAQAGFATIKEIAGTVELKRPGSANYVHASVGDRVANATIISTGFRSSAVLDTGSSTITVRPLTNLSLETIMDTGNAETTNLELKTGRIRVDVNPPTGSRTNFNVQSPSSTASVRGTNFEMDFMNLKVNKGTVQLGSAASDQPVVVIAGQSSWVDAETGKAINSYDAGELNRALPAMPGQGSMPGATRSQTKGLFAADITLISKE